MSSSCPQDLIATAEGNRDIATGDYITAEVELFSLREHLNMDAMANVSLWCILVLAI